MILQVHDELNFDLLKSETDKVKKIVKEEMEHAVNWLSRLKLRWQLPKLAAGPLGNRYSSLLSWRKFSLTAISYFDILTDFFTRLKALWGFGKRKQKYSQNLVMRVIR